MNKRFLGLVGLLALLFMASCEIESIEELEILHEARQTDGTQTSPKGKKD